MDAAVAVSILTPPHRSCRPPMTLHASRASCRIGVFRLFPRRPTMVRFDCSNTRDNSGGAARAASCGGDKGMSEGELRVDALARLALLVPGEQDTSGVLQRLMNTATDVLNVAGAAVTLVADGRTEVAGARPDLLAELEGAQR